MQLPFTTEQFFTVIHRYNETVWPAQTLLTALAALALALVWSRRAWAVRAICVTLAVLWAWSGIAYHFAFFAAINPAAYAFGLLFCLGAVAFLARAISPGDLVFSVRQDATTVTGFALVLYALVIYPAWSSLSGHAYPNLPTFGLPCPTTIFTIGMLALARGNRAWLLFIAPVLWALVGTQAAFLLTVLPDLGLGVAGLIGMALALRSRQKSGSVAHAS
jgi:hypothetical protein